MASKYKVDLQIRNVCFSMNFENTIRNIYKRFPSTFTCRRNREFIQLWGSEFIRSIEVHILCCVNRIMKMQSTNSQPQLVAFKTKNTYE